MASKDSEVIPERAVKAELCLLHPHCYCESAISLTAPSTCLQGLRKLGQPQAQEPPPAHYTCPHSLPANPLRELLHRKQLID